MKKKKIFVNNKISIMPEAGFRSRPIKSGSSATLAILLYTQVKYVIIVAAA